ncbi:MAG: NUDIX hydrolase [Pseudomonadota bacterium]
MDKACGHANYNLISIDVPMSDKTPPTFDLEWEHLGTRYDTDAGLILFDKRMDTLRNPRNGKTFERLVLESVDWVNVVALDPEERCVMIRQYRFGVGYTTLETPGGMVDPGEDSRTAAARELLEETGYTTDRWTYLGAVEPNPAFQNNLCHHWLAQEVVRSSQQELGDGEAIRIELFSEDQVRAAVQEGELKHALALSALARVYSLWPLPYAQPGELPRR